MTSIVDLPIDGFQAAQQVLFEHLVEPVLMGIGEGRLAEDAFDATAWFLVGVLQVAAMILLIRPLERRWPIEPVVDRPAVRVDVLYTLLQRLGLFHVAMFFLLEPAWDAASGQMRWWGLPTWQLDALAAPLLPGVTDTAVFALLAYLVVLDGVEYLIHRGQHRFRWWWALHAVHHSQRQMTLWSDARNHLLDDALHATVMALVARVIGVEPGQFLAIATIRPLIESLAHANTRIHFGAIGSHLLVGPRFHRLHHAAVIDGVPGLAAPDTRDVRDAADSAPRACNYAVLFPLWDVVGRTACFAPLLLPTGIGDARTSNDARDHGRGFWQPQWLALRRLFASQAPMTPPTPEEALP